MARKSFSVHSDFYNEIRNLSAEQRGDLLLALVNTADDEDAPELDPMCAMLHRLMLAQMERVSSANSANGSKGGRGNKSEKSEDNEESGEKPKKPTVSLSVTSPVSVPEEVFTGGSGGVTHTREEETAVAYYMDRVNPIAAPTTLELLGQYEYELSTEVVKHAIDVALGEKKTNWSYIQGILRRYSSGGIRCLADVQRADAEWEARKDNAHSQPRGQPTERVDPFYENARRKLEYAASLDASG